MTFYYVQFLRGNRYTNAWLYYPICTVLHYYEPSTLYVRRHFECKNVWEKEKTFIFSNINKKPSVKHLESGSSSGPSYGNVHLLYDQLSPFPLSRCLLHHRISWFQRAAGLHRLCWLPIRTGAPSMPAQSSRGGERKGTPNYDIGGAGEQRSVRILMEMQKGVVWSWLIS